LNENKEYDSIPKDVAKLELWNEFCSIHCINKIGVPLFITKSDGIVETFRYGLDGRFLLKRSQEMEDLLIKQVEYVLEDPTDFMQGILYMMFKQIDENIVYPLYIGRAGRFGHDGHRVSANLVNIRKNTSKFGRWGYNYAYHIGDLSAAVLIGHNPIKISPKYKRWGQALFDEIPSDAPRLKYQVKFWCTAWNYNCPNIWQEFGSCSLGFIEYLLIGVAAILFPESLLNEEGVK
jgi:hypothetical protein